jgi:uncharacterized membrane protein YhaH (DUF805 family)
MNWYLKVLKDYANFSGRARRQEYWMFVLFNMIFAIVAMILDKIIGSTFKIETAMGAQSLPYGYIYLLYILATLVPSLAVFVRRMHDVGKSGWFIFISLIPLIGAIWLLILLCTAGVQGENEYGADPKNADAAISDKTILDSNVNA